MIKEEITIQSITSDDNVLVGYSDKDLVIVDNVKKLVNPTAARMNMNMLVICTAGRVQGYLNGTLMTLSRNQVAICPPNVTLTNLMMSPKFEFKSMFFTTQILHNFLHERIKLWNEMMYIQHLHILTMKDKQIKYYTNFYEMLSLYMAPDNDTPFKTDIIQSLLRAAFLALCGRMKREAMREADTENNQQTSNSLFQRFLHQLQSAKVRHRPVEHYAAELCVTPKYLSAVCKKNSGKTANEWITEYVVEDIRYYLCNTDYSIKQICPMLGFPNPSFFGKYVRHHFGMTPIQLRRS